MTIKPGILAYIVNSKFPENNGLVVEVIKLAGVYAGQRQWSIRSFGKRMTVDFYAGLLTRETEATSPESKLRPITGLPDADVIDTDDAQPVERKDEVAA